MQITDGNAAERLRSRDPQALAFVMDAYGDSVYRLLALIIGPAAREDLEECASDVFLRVWERIGQYDEARGSLKVWLHQLAKYRALDYRRKSFGLPRLDPLGEEPADAATTEGLVMRREERMKLVELVRSLPDLDRQLFVHRYVYERRQQDIAERLGLTVKAVENRLARMRKWLKLKLEPEREEGRS